NSSQDLNCATLKEKNAEHGDHKEEICVNAGNGALVTRQIFALNSKDASRFEDYSSFGQKAYPRHLRFVEDGKDVVQASIDDIRTGPLDSALFSAIAGVDAWPTCDHVKHPVAIRQPDPEYPPDAMRKETRGTTTLYVQVGIDGTVKKIGIQRSVDPSIDA